MRPELEPEILLNAYRQGIFPMGEADDNQIRWYSPDPRTIIDLADFHVPKRLARTVRHSAFEIRMDTAFEKVITLCSRQRESAEKSLLADGIWITDEIIEAYTKLHQLKIAHSVEAFEAGKLVGGLYGVAINGAFMGESMFHIARDASKVCLVHLVEHLKARNFALLDCQYMTGHLHRFGAKEISKKEYLVRLAVALKLDCKF
jgi:leucyl/phenylalanyl-tRNA--protein transferase